MTTKVELFVTMGCPFCQRAMAWMKEFNVEHTLTVFNSATEKMAFYAANLGVSTVPQIFIDGTRLGGWTDLVASDFRKHIEAEFKK